MTGQLVGHVKTIFRYPIKSMQGELVESVELDEFGICGDRKYGLRLPDGRIASAKRTTELLSYEAFYEGDSVMIRLPSGETIAANDSAINERLSKLLGTEIVLEERHAKQQNFGELDANTIFGDTPIHEALEGKKRQLATDAVKYDLATGTFYDSAHLHLLATCTLKHLETMLDGQSKIDVHRFRPNIVIETMPELEGFVEDTWIGGQLLVGDSLMDDTVVISELWPTLRCVMTTLPQRDLPHDPKILRKIVKEHENHLGIFATAKTYGKIQVGDAVKLEGI